MWCDSSTALTIRTTGEPPFQIFSKPSANAWAADRCPPPVSEEMMRILGVFWAIQRIGISSCLQIFCGCVFQQFHCDVGPTSVFSFVNSRKSNGLLLRAITDSRLFPNGESIPGASYQSLRPDRHLRRGVKNQMDRFVEIGFRVPHLRIRSRSTRAPANNLRVSLIVRPNVITPGKSITSPCIPS